jgi:decaprenyl-phosphate phosphoribosyltransferase
MGIIGGSAPGRYRRAVISGIIRTARPKQWLKNVLVFAAPGAAGVLNEGRPFVLTVVAFVSF